MRTAKDDDMFQINVDNSKKTLQHLRPLSSLLIAWIVCLFLFTLSITAVFALPQSSIQANARASAAILEEEGSWPLSIISLDKSVCDNFSTAVGFNTACHNSGNALESAMRCARYDSAELDGVKDFSEGFDKEANTGYAWYWHGYLVLLKPLLLFFDIKGIRIFLLVVLSVLFAAACCRIHKLSGIFCSIIFAIAFAYAAVYTVALSPTLFFSFAIALAGVLVVSNPRIDSLHSGMLLSFFCIGASTAFFDFFNTPLVTWALPLITLVMAKQKELEGSGFVKTAKMILILSFSWLLGYAGLWASKWLIASIVMGENVLQDAIAHVFLWTGANTSDNFEISASIDRFSGLNSNLMLFMPSRVLRLCLAAAFIVGLLALIVIGIKDRANVSISAIFCMVIALMPLLWFLVVNAHSTLHYWFTFRNLVVTLYGLGVFWWLLTPGILSLFRKPEKSSHTI